MSRQKRARTEQGRLKWRVRIGWGAAAGAAVVLVALAALSSTFGFSAPNAGAEPKLAAAVDVQRVDLPGGTPGYVFTLGVMASGDADAALRFRDGRRYDFVLRRDGKEVWRWSDGRAFHQAVHTVVLPAGRLHTFVYVWDGTDRDGAPLVGPLQLEAEVLSESPLRTEPVPLHPGADDASS